MGREWVLAVRIPGNVLNTELPLHGQLFPNETSDFVFQAYFEPTCQTTLHALQQVAPGV